MTTKPPIEIGDLPVLADPPETAEVLLYLPNAQAGSRGARAPLPSGSGAAPPEATSAEASTTATTGAEVSTVRGWSVRRLREFVRTFVTPAFVRTLLSSLVGADRLDISAVKGAPDQRVLIDPQVSADTQGKWNMDPRGEAYLTEPVPHPTSEPTATFDDYTSDEYLGPRYTLPGIGVSAENSRRAQVTVGEGVWTYLIGSGVAWTVELGDDLTTLSWVQRDIDLLVPGDGTYSGRWESDDIATAHITKVGDFYYRTNSADLRYATAYTPGQVRYSYEELRILNAHDLHALGAQHQQLVDRIALAEYANELGSEFDIYDVSTPDGYARVLTDRVANDDLDANNRILWLNIIADVSGNFQALGDQAAQPYTWKAGDALVAPPRRNDVERVRRQAQTGSGVGNVRVYQAAGGTRNAITLADATNPVTAYTDDLTILFRVGNDAPNGVTTVKIDALAAIPLRTASGVALSAGLIADGQWVHAVYQSAGSQLIATNVGLPGAADAGGLSPERAAQIDANTTRSQANERAIAGNTTARWPGHASVRPAEVAHDVGAFTMRATLDRVSGTFPNGAQMRLVAYARTGAFVPAVANDDNTPAELAYTAEQAAAVLLQARHHTLTAMLQVYDDNQATTLLAELPVYITVRQASDGGQREFGEGSEDIAAWARGNSPSLLPDDKTPQRVVDAIGAIIGLIQGFRRLNPETAGTTDEYATVLTNQRTSTSVTLLHVTADIADSTAAPPYQWLKDTYLWLIPGINPQTGQPSDVAPIFLFRIAPGDAGDGVVILSDGSAIRPTRDTLNQLVFDPFAGTMTRTAIVPLKVRDMASSDLTGGRELGGVLESGPIPEDSKYYFYRGGRIAASNINTDTWVRWVINGAPSTINISVDLVAGLSWQGVQADLPAIAAHATAIGQIYAHGTTLSVVERPQGYIVADLLDHVMELTPAANIDWEVDIAHKAHIELTENVILSLSGGRDVDFAVLRVTQDATGGRVLTLGDSIEVADRGQPVLSTAPGTNDLIMFTRVGEVWVYVGIIAGVSVNA